MPVAGRDDEVKMLESMLTSTESEFVAMYGRRRIGKTFLIEETYRKNTVFFASGIHEENMLSQHENFFKELNAYFKLGKKDELPTTWLKAFALLEKCITNLTHTTKKVIFLDEISWLDTPKSGFVGALNNFWNTFCNRRKDIVLVICGSAASWIINKVIKNKGGLHNRITNCIQLMPFTLQETEAFLKLRNINLSRRDVVLIYMCTGGVPYYLKFITPGKSVPQVINDLFFKQNASLKLELNNLYASLFKNAYLHEAIVMALAKTKGGLTRNALLVQTNLVSGGGISLVLEELVQCGFITRVYPYSNKKTYSIFRLTDFFTLFYLRFVPTDNSILNWDKLAGSQSYKIWCGYAFETLCALHINKIKGSLSILGVLSNEYSWYKKGNSESKGAQIDLIIDRDDNCINICEMKFYKEQYIMTKTDEDNLRNKIAVFRHDTKTKKNIFITLITLNGYFKNKYSLSIVTNSIEVDALF